MMTIRDITHLPDFNPLQEPERAERFVRTYLSPCGLGGMGHRAHQFTINGLTYPFIRHYNFAAVPDVPVNRQYDMYSGVHLAQPGDLLFFFEADPHIKNKGINSRRGIRGIYRVAGLPYRARQDAFDYRQGGTSYRLLSRCPKCEYVYSTLKTSCLNCKEDFPMVEIEGESFPTLLLSTRIPIEPFFLFERSVSDERVYADFRDPGLIWVGRHDNAMGAGKGSSIRQLMPEEASKLLRLLITEPEQHIGANGFGSDPVGENLTKINGESVDFLPLSTNGFVLREDELYFTLVRQTLEDGSHFRNLLLGYMPEGISWENLEYVSSTFPWGYTAGAADFVLIFRAPPPQGRSFIVIVECKRERAHDEAVRQVLLYAERVVQVAFLSASKDAYPDNEALVLPIIIAADTKQPRNIDNRIAIPKPYLERARYFGGDEVCYKVHSPIFLKYETNNKPRNNSIHYKDINFSTLTENKWKHISWSPPLGAVGTLPELDWIRDGSWQSARIAAGFQPC